MKSGPGWEVSIMRRVEEMVSLVGLATRLEILYLNISMRRKCSVPSMFE
jgi:hypothetical protein